MAGECFRRGEAWPPASPLLCPLRASTQDNTLVSGVCCDGYPARSTTSTPGTTPSSSLALEPVQGHPGRYPGMVVQNRLEHGQQGHVAGALQERRQRLVEASL